MANASFSLLNPPLNAGTNEWITLSWDEDVTGLLFSEISVVGGTIVGTAFDSSSTADTYYFQVTVPSGNGRVTVSIAENVVAEGNPATSQGFDYGTGSQDATLTISTTETDLYAGKTFDIDITSDVDISNFALSDVTVTGGTANSLTETDARNFVLNVTAGAAGTLNVDIAEDVVSPGNAAVDQDFTIVALDALTVTISGTTNIEQGGQTTLSAAVTNPDGVTITSGLTYAWTASRGSFPNGATGASVTYEADFTDSNDVDVDIECSVTRAANDSPTVSTGSLTAMADLGITGQILNMYITETEASSNGSNKVIYAAGSDDSALADGSDDDITNAINTWRVQYHPSNDWLILNNDGSGDLNAFFENNTTQSVYLIFSDGEYYEITNARYDNGGSGWIRWDVTAISALATKLDAIGADDTLLVGVGDADSVGYIAGSGSGEATVTATASTTEATFTITTDDTDIREGESVDFAIASSIDITNFVVGDVTVTGGTANSLTGSDQDWTLNVTADTGAGSIVISIAENVVSPGNHAISRTFTRRARVTATITVSPTTLTENDAAVLTIQLSESVTGLAGSNITVTGATKGTFTEVDGDTYTQAITVDPGAGTVSVSIDADVTTPQNAAVSEDFTYVSDTIPRAPAGFGVLSVTSTSATLGWTIGGDGGSALTMTQVSSDGGTNWTDISATDTSYTFSGLLTDTQYQFAVRHVNSVGAGLTATLTQRTGIAYPTMEQLHDTLFLQNLIESVEIHGTSTVITEMTDNDYSTYSDETDIDISLGSTAKTIQFIFIKYTGTLTSYIATPSGGSGSAISRTVPATVMDVLGNSVSTEVSGYKHEMLPVSDTTSGTALQIEFTGTDLQVYDLKVLQILFDTNANRDWRQFTPAKVDTQGSLRQNKGGGYRRSPSLGNLRWLWQYDVQLLCTKLTGIDARVFLAFLKNNPQCVMMRAFTEHPAQVVPVTFSELTVDINPRGQSKQFGETLAFTIKERGTF